MKKTFYTFAILGLLALQQNNVQAQAFQKGNKLVNVGLGLGAYGVKSVVTLGKYGADINSSGTHNAVGLGATFEYGVTDDISVGALLGYSSKTETSTILLSSQRGDKYSYIHFGVRGSYHLNNILKLQNDKLDVYAGAGLGYRTISNSGITADAALWGTGFSNVFIPVHVGGRYYFQNNMAAFAELGTGFSIFQGGISFKL